MNELEFEWDAVKAAQNEADHGIIFEMARDVFKDPVAIEWLDDREDYGEDRYVIIGMVDRPAHISRHDQSTMDLRTGPSATERRTWPRPLRGTILARPSSASSHDNDRVCICL